MIEKFKFGIYLPTIQEYGHFQELTSSHYLDIIKFIQNNDDDNLVTALQGLVDNLISDKSMIDKLSRIDMFCILLNLRIVCVGSSVELKIRCPKTKKPFNVPVDLYDILDSVTNYDIKYTEKIKVGKKCVITLVPPKSIQTHENDDIVLNSISKITLNNIDYDPDEYTAEQKSEILDNLPGNALKKIVSHINRNHEQYNIHAIKYKSPHDSTSEHVTYDLQLYNNSFFEFIKTIYNANLEEQYYLRYILSHRLGFNNDYIESRSPAEIDTYIGFYKQELEEQKKQNEKHAGGGQQGPMIPSATPPMS